MFSVMTLPLRMRISPRGTGCASSATPPFLTHRYTRAATAYLAILNIMKVYSIFDVEKAFPKIMSLKKDGV